MGAAVSVTVSSIHPRFLASSLRGLLYPIVQTVVVEHNIEGISDNFNDDYCQCSCRAAPAVPRKQGKTIEYNDLMLCIMEPRLEP